MKVVKKKTPRKTQPKRGNAAHFKNEGFKEIRDLGQDRYALINQYFLEGKTAVAIARIIKEDWLELPNTDTETLARQLRRLKKDEIDPKVLIQANMLPADVQARMVKQMKGNLDTIEEMQAICIDATSAYKTLSLHAQQTNMATDMRKASDSGKQTLSMLKDLASVQMEAGIIARAPRVVSAHVNFARTAAEDSYLTDVKVRKERSLRARSILDMLTEDDAIDVEFDDIEVVDDAPVEDD